MCVKYYLDLREKAARKLKKQQQQQLEEAAAKSAAAIELCESKCSAESTNGMCSAVEPMVTNSVGTVSGSAPQQQQLQVEDSDSESEDDDYCPSGASDESDSDDSGSDASGASDAEGDDSKDEGDDRTDVRAEPIRSPVGNSNGKRAREEEAVESPNKRPVPFN